MPSAESCIEVIAPPTAARVARLGVTRHARPESAMMSVVTLVVWTGCLLVGGLGFALPYMRPHQPLPAAAITQAELLTVELTNDPLPPLDPQPSSKLAPPPLEPVPAPANLPALMAVAPMSAEVAFAMPVEGPVRVVDVAQASYARPTERPAVATAPASVEPLTYGVGEGRQPAPQYPREAVRTGQEGRVAVRFSVGENGRVIAAEATSPSPWPLLNDEAVRTVRQRWRFRGGPVRLYEVTIRFELQKSRGES